MHTMVLGFAGYSLLLSGCIALIFLLKIGCFKDILKTPLHILSTSDTLISVVTSIILLLNQSIPLNNFEQDPTMSVEEEISDRQLFSHQEQKELRQNETCMRFSYKYDDSWLASQDINGTAPKCVFQHVLMHYAMFLVPFANAFISLLIYSMQCSSGISCINKRCSSLIRMSQNSSNDNGHEPANLGLRQKNLHVQEDSNAISKAPEVDNEAQETVINIADMENITKNTNNKSKFTGFGLTVQWLIPALVTAILYFSRGQDMDKVRELSEMECVFKVNFPLESCYETNSGNVESVIYHEENYSESSGYFEVDDPDTVMSSYPHSEKIDEVVLRVRNVLESVLKKTCNKTSEMKYSENFKPWNITKYVAVTNLTQGIKSNENEILEKLANIQETLDSKYPEIYKNYECESNNNSDLIRTFPEVFGAIDSIVFDEVLVNKNRVTSKLIPLITKMKPEDLIYREIIAADTLTRNKDIQASINTSTNEDQDKNENQTAGYKAATYGNKTTTHEIDKNIERKLNGQIYPDIIKRIRDTVKQVEVKAQTGNSHDNYEVNRVKFDTGLFHKQFSDNEVEISALNPNARSINEDKKTVENFYAKNEGKQMLQVPVYMDERCLLSMKFLKVHLLILLFLIYFTPLFISVTLQTRAMYACNNILDKIDRTDKKNSKASPFTKRTLVSDQTLVNKDPLKPGWFGDESGTMNNDLGESSSGLENLKVIQQSNIIQSDRSAAIQSVQQLGFDSEMQKNEETGYKNVMHEIKSVQMLFGILKKTLILSILMWTPAFIEILSKVFLCSSTPGWLVDILYLLGVSFGIVKNYLNVSIAKINKNSGDQMFVKENSILPSTYN